MSEKFFNSLPQFISGPMVTAQLDIEDAVKAACPEAECTSGFRCPAYNRTLQNACMNSLHQYALARDYKKHPKFPLSLPGLRIVEESDHYHVEVIV